MINIYWDYNRDPIKCSTLNPTPVYIKRDSFKEGKPGTLEGLSKPALLRDCMVCRFWGLRV